jgi:hypothetical protein
MENPDTVYDALYNMPDAEWEQMCVDIFGSDRKDIRIDIDDVMEKIIETDTCGNLDSPVSVWIDEEGYYTVDVW